MLWLARKPAPPLDQFVSLIWYVEQRSQPHAFERLMPTPGSCIIFNLLEDRVLTYNLGGRPGVREACGSVLVGPVEEHFVIETAEQQKVAGVQFRAHGASAFSRMPASELADIDIPLADLWGE